MKNRFPHVPRGGKVLVYPHMTCISLGSMGNHIGTYYRGVQKNPPPMQFPNGLTSTTWCGAETEFHGPVIIYRDIIKVNLAAGIENLVPALLPLCELDLHPNHGSQVL